MILEIGLIIAMLISSGEMVDEYQMLWAGYVDMRATFNGLTVDRDIYGERNPFACAYFEAVGYDKNLMELGGAVCLLFCSRVFQNSDHLRYILKPFLSILFLYEGSTWAKTGHWAGGSELEVSLFLINF